MTARINGIASKRFAIRPVNAFAGAAPARLVLIGDGVAVTDQLERESLFGLHGFAPFPPASRWGVFTMRADAPAVISDANRLPYWASRFI